MNKPRVGAASDEHGPDCAFSVEPGEPLCGNRATRHLLVKDATYGEVALQTCDEHVDVARQAGELLQEHVFEVACGLPTAQWFSNRNACTRSPKASERSDPEGEQ